MMEALRLDWLRAVLDELADTLGDRHPAVRPTMKGLYGATRAHAAFVSVSTATSVVTAAMGVVTAVIGVGASSALSLAALGFAGLSLLAQYNDSSEERLTRTQTQLEHVDTDLRADRERLRAIGCLDATPCDDVAWALVAPDDTLDTKGIAAYENWLACRSVGNYLEELKIGVDEGVLDGDMIQRRAGDLLVMLRDGIEPCVKWRRETKEDSWCELYDAAGEAVSFTKKGPAMACPQNDAF